MKHSNLLCVLLTVALVLLSIKIAFLDHSSAPDTKSQEEAVMDNIRTRIAKQRQKVSASDGQMRHNHHRGVTRRPRQKSLRVNTDR